MGLKLNIDTENGIIQIFLSGKLSLDLMMEQRSLIIKSVKEYKLRRVLLDFSKTTGKLSVFEYFEMASTFRDSFKDPIRLGINLDTNRLPKDKQEFIETTYRNHGINLRIFYNFDDTEKWLKELN